MSECLYDENQFDSVEVEDRIIELLAECDHDDVVDPAQSLSSEDRRELNFLSDLRHDFHEQEGWESTAWTDGVVIIRGFHALVEYVRDTMMELHAELFDRMADELDNALVIDWEATTHGLLSRWSTFDADGQQFWYQND